MRELKSYLVVVKDATYTHDGDGRAWKQRRSHYVVGTSDRSAIRQAKRMAGYSEKASETRGNVVHLEVIERIGFI